MDLVGTEQPPPSPKEALILRLLAEKPRYGRALCEASKGALTPGTAYVTLGRMVKKGYLTSEKIPRKGQEIGPQVRIYTVTPLGTKVLEALGQLETLLPAKVS